jgi:hypothetical protein
MAAEEPSPLIEVANNNVTLEELQQQIQKTQLRNIAYRKENNLFDSYLKRLGSHANTIVPNILSTQTLTLEQKFLIATSELKEVKDEIESTKESSEKFLEQLRVGALF